MRASYTWSLVTIVTTSLLIACRGSNDFARSMPVSVAPGTDEPSSTAESGRFPAAKHHDIEFAYVADDAYTGGVNGYSINTGTGGLTQVKGLPVGACCFSSAAVTPKNHFLYAANELYFNVRAYAINVKNGSLREVRGSPFGAGDFPAGELVEPNSRFLYVISLYQIDGYTIDHRTGSLYPIPGSPFSGPVSYGVATDPGGKFLYVPDYDHGNVWAYLINQKTGALTNVKGSPFKSGASPLAIAVDPAGKFVYVPGCSSNTGLCSGNISAYVIERWSGALKPVTGSPFSTGGSIFGITVDPTGKFAYATNSSGDDVFAYAIDARTGALTAVTGSPFLTGALPLAVAVDPNGQFAYVGNADANTVSGYTINAATGSLRPVIGSPFATGVYPAGIAICRIRAGTC